MTPPSSKSQNYIALPQEKVLKPLGLSPCIFSPCASMIVTIMFNFKPKYKLFN